MDGMDGGENGPDGGWSPLEREEVKEGEPCDAFPFFAGNLSELELE